MPRNIIKTELAVNMGDGWETARRLDRPAVLVANEATGILEVPGHEWAVFRLGLRGTPDSILIDTNHFKVRSNQINIPKFTVTFVGKFS